MNEKNIFPLLKTIGKKNIEIFLNNYISDNGIKCICDKAYDVLYTKKYRIPFKERAKQKRYILKKFSRQNICTIANKKNPISKRKAALLQEGGSFVEWLRKTIDKVNVFLQKAVIGDY